MPFEYLADPVKTSLWTVWAEYYQVPIKRVGPNKQVGWIFKYINFIKEYLGPNK